MKLPISPPVEPMLARSVPEIPTEAGMTYEPKWDGYRCIVFRDGDEVELASRDGKTLTRYFPEVIEQVRQQFPARCAVDGELIVIRRNGPGRAPRLDFDLLGQRIHPAASRVRMLAGATPADLPYQPGKRLMFKVKHARTADVVVAGFRWHRSGPVVGSLLLGLYDDAGILHHVGVCAPFTAKRRAELLETLAPYRGELLDRPWVHGDHGSGQRIPGGPGRCSGAKNLEWEPIRPVLVVEVGYDAMEGDRFRHTTQFVRWRPDRDPRSCRCEQLERPIRYDVDQVLRGDPAATRD